MSDIGIRYWFTVLALLFAWTLVRPGPPAAPPGIATSEDGHEIAIEKPAPGGSNSEIYYRRDNGELTSVATRATNTLTFSTVATPGVMTWTTAPTGYACAQFPDSTMIYCEQYARKLPLSTNATSFVTSTMRY